MKTAEEKTGKKVFCIIDSMTGKTLATVVATSKSEADKKIRQWQQKQRKMSKGEGVNK